MSDTPDEMVIYRPRQEIVEPDLMVAQQAQRDARDAMAAELLTDQPGYAGMSVAKTSGTVVTVQPGSLYQAGERYALSAAQPIDLYGLLPTGAGLRVVSIVVSGEEVDVEPDTRNFALSADLNAPRVPQSVMTRRRRVATAYTVAGAIAPQPSPPAIVSGYVEICRVVLDAAGIVGDPAMVAATRAPNLLIVATALAEQADTLARFGEALETQNSDIAELSQRIDGCAPKRQAEQLSREVAVIRELLDLKDDYTDTGEDVFTTDDESDTGHADFDCIVDDGIRFPTAQQAQALSLFTANDAAVMVSGGGLCLPAWDPVTRVDPKSLTGTIRPKDYTVADRTVRRLHKSRLYYLYGRGLARDEMIETLQQTRQLKVFDPAANAWVAVDLRGKSWKIKASRASPHFFSLWIDDPYADFVTTSVVVSGAGIAQTWRSGAVQWLTGLDVAVTTIDGSGPLHLAVCRVTASGEPDIGNALAVSQLAAASLIAWPQWSRVPVEPTLLTPGERIAFVLLTTGNHVLGTVGGGAINAGTLFYNADGTYWFADADKDLAIRPVFAKFRKDRTTVELASIALSGGMRELHLAATAVEPRATKLRLNAKVAGGGGWKQLDDTDDAILVAAPDVTQLRAVFNGSETAQPGIELANSRLTALRRQAAFTHVSDVRTLDSASDDIEVKLELLDFDETHHDVTITLLIGGGYTTAEAADALVVRETVNERTKIAKATFSPASPVSSYKIKIEGATDDTAITFAVVRRRDIARA